jgi:NADP-dependent 3-hydroxy acid dehydrogenase YdfG
MSLMHNRRVLVTGATGGIGSAIVRAFCEAGAKVVATDFDARASAEAPGLPDEVDFVQGDLTEPKFLHDLTEHAGDIDTLVNCAAWLRHSAIMESERSEWERAFRTNVIAPLHLTKLVAAGMAECGEGRIIMVSSALARLVYPYTAIYAATKHALRALCVGLRMELNPLGIGVTELCPGVTSGSKILRGTKGQDVLGSVKSRERVRLSPDDIAHAALFAATQSKGADVAVLEVKPFGQS